jgi:UPF0716 family protein affecting phage T7 exclusion
MTVLAVLFLLAGLIVGLVGVLTLWPALRLVLRGRQVTGTLVRWRFTWDKKYLPNGSVYKRDGYHPIVRFQTPDGAQYFVEGNDYNPRPDWPLGHPFDVRYDRANPRDATTDGNRPSWRAGAILLAVGVVLIIAAIWLIVS